MLSNVEIQAQLNKYLLYFPEKQTISNSNITAEKVLSNRSIQRRYNNQLKFDHYDIPISNNLLRILVNQGINIKSKSKWLNAAIVETNKTKEELESFEVVKKVVPISKYKSSKFKSYDAFSYFSNVNRKNEEWEAIQDQIIGIKYLHDKGIMGENILIAFFDSGFNGFQNISYFSHIFNENRVVGTFDFWDNTNYVYGKSDHGTMVASIISSNVENSFVGFAPNAYFAFAITENTSIESIEEEFYYAAACEWADSLGADIISASLNYMYFDDKKNNYSFADLDGNTTITAKAINIAASKGIIVVVPTGNVYTSSNRHIYTPCDADNAVCVGGADEYKNHDYMSLIGPTADGRIKPDLAALTRKVSYINSYGNLSTFSGYGGTSVAVPQITGLIACLKQAHPTLSNFDIIEALKKSGHQASFPDNLIGHGVPNAFIADSLLSLKDKSNLTSFPEKIINNKNLINVYKDLNFNKLIVKSNCKTNIQFVELYSSYGKIFYKEFLNHESWNIDLSALKQGIFIIRIGLDNEYCLVQKIVNT